MTQTEGLTEHVSVEKGLVGRQVTIVDRTGLGIEKLQYNVGQRLGIHSADWGDEQLPTVENGLMGSREKATAGLGAGEDSVDRGGIEAEWTQQFEKELAAKGNVVGEGKGPRCVERKETDTVGAFGTRSDKLATEGFEEGGIELLDRLKVGDGSGYCRVGRGLYLAEEGKHLVADLVAAIEE